MNTHAQNNDVKAGPPAPALPQDKTQALHALMKATQDLITMAEKEAQVLAQNDMLGFAILQDEKNVFVERYSQLSSEFRARMNSFRGVDKALLGKLETLQDSLSEKSKANNDLVFKIYERAKAKTQTTLLTAQELGQQSNIRFDAPEPQIQEDAR